MNGKETPPGGHDWGEKTLQALDGYPDFDGEPDERPRSYDRHHTDADEIRRRYGMEPYDDDVWDSQEYAFPKCLNHSLPEANGWGHAGGTNFLGVGGKGSGKSTFGLYWGTRLMEANDECVVWRGTPSRSEWLPLRHWTTLWLPAGVDVDPVWKPRDMTQQNAGEPASLEDIVRDVKRYDDPTDLNQRLEPATFNVVYPDPSFTGCEEIMSNSDYVPTPVSFTTQDAAEEPADATPVVHWWYAYFVSKLDDGPWDWTSVIFDETEDLAPQSARADAHETYTKIESLRRVMDQSRKFALSVYWLAQNEPDLHQKIRRTIQWRVATADESGNPTDASGVIGFREVPMKYNILSSKSVGHGLLYQEQSFSPFSWPDISDPSVSDRWLSISLTSAHTYARVNDPHGHPPDEGEEVADD